MKARQGYGNKASALEKEVQKAKEITLRFEKERLLRELENDIRGFDDGVDRCIKEKRVLERDMKIASMKLVTLYQELLIMTEMEEKDQ